MKQIVFVVVLVAMTSFTGCLSFDEEESQDESLINPIDAYGPPQVSTIMVDYGIIGIMKDCENDGENGTGDNCDDYFIPCISKGWYDIDKDGDYEYCDIDGHYNDGPQVIVSKVGNNVLIECIKSYDENYCKSGEYVYVIFTSIEGLKEMIECNMINHYYDNNGERQPMFIKCEAELGFEPASFEISSSRSYFNSYDGGEDYYNNVVFRVF